MNDNLNPNGLFSDELKELAILEKEASEKAIPIDEQINELKSKVDALKASREELFQPVTDKRAEIQSKTSDLFDMAKGDEETLLSIRANLHHGISVRMQKELVYDDKQAREYVITNKMWDFINKPNISKSAIKKAFKAGSIDWVEIEEVEKISITVSDKLGDILMATEGNA